jgi:hypothetical protein
MRTILLLIGATVLFSSQAEAQSCSYYNNRCMNWARKAGWKAGNEAYYGCGARHQKCLTTGCLKVKGKGEVCNIPRH